MRKLTADVLPFSNLCVPRIHRPNATRNRLSSYLGLLNAQVAAHNACNGNHMCLVGVWIPANTITGLLSPLVKAVELSSIAPLVCGLLGLS